MTRTRQQSATEEPEDEGATGANGGTIPASPSGRKARILRDFDVPYEGTTTYFTKDQDVYDAALLAYLNSVQAPIEYVED